MGRIRWVGRLWYGGVWTCVLASTVRLLVGRFSGRCRVGTGKKGLMPLVF